MCILHYTYISHTHTYIHIYPYAHTVENIPCAHIYIACRYWHTHKNTHTHSFMHMDM